MKLYYSPLACSLADHISLVEAEAPFERESVDLKTKRTASGTDYRGITPKGYVPALVLDDGEILTENIAILDWLAAKYPALGVPGTLGRTRLLEALAFISTEVHGNFKPIWHAENEVQKARARMTISGFLDILSESLKGDYLFGAAPSVADFYLFVMLLWAERFDVSTPAPLIAMRQRIARRPAVQTAMQHEGLVSAIGQQADAAA
ncbi:glutathione S-transferase C-terminal domain-containing protein [Mesorhizobium sp.]|uniref:glutathione S-transferase C-terminal domain-containing protein n=1 Tax=Mesorhizobium sp. TaxID=1871066 RepID=UPI000FE7B283|nr:glutathione S-transferase C-terminal domain-containing protein [Mesorhizobium sp.]RWM18555.1 MAG: glutathione S-transferase [Mesorhizobium sp.]RWM35775.1 MAG: glutathione S-transferase [Mesorhizobium sp.]TIO72688.1 MAG: glutathione S-transferase [Mesorhizobium sp.]TIO80698.1 MAG: glutathione S-transferase [Mesorhizobium sp.]TJV49136.1 MAG: glutathione S-transferase [Mesorhizobium sp.]